MDVNPDRVDQIRRTRSEVENHVIDELFAGRITRRDFVRRMSVLGMSASLAGFLAACSSDNGGGTSPSATGSSGATGAVAPGGTLKTGIIAPASGLDPLLVNDEGGLAVLGQSGEYLTWSNDQLELEPRIAESWTPNDDGSVWTFSIRQGVTFQDGTPLTADDVVATMELHTDPKNKSNALSAFTGVLSPGGSQGRRRRRPSSSRWTRRTATSRTWSAPTTTTSSSCRRRMPGAGTRPSSGPARGSCRPTRPTSASRTARTPTTGTRPGSRTPTRTRSRSTRRTRRRSWGSRAARSTSSASSRPSRDRPC